MIPYAWLKRGLPDMMDISVLVTGISLAVHFSITPWDDAWFAVKLLVVLLYIALGFVCFSTRFPLWVQRLAGVGAISLLMLVVYLAVTKNISFV